MSPLSVPLLTLILLGCRVLALVPLTLNLPFASIVPCMKWAGGGVASLSRAVLSQTACMWQSVAGPLGGCPRPWSVVTACREPVECLGLQGTVE